MKASPPTFHALSPRINDGMPMSARNKLRGKIKEIELGDIMAL
jgi:hypothetical protein